MVQADIADGKLPRLLADWHPPIPGYHPRDPSRRRHLPWFSPLLDALRERA